MKQSLRFRVLSVLFVIIFFLTGIKLIQTTLFPDERLRTTNYRITTPRGNIYDTRGRLIAGISSTSSLYVRPALISTDLKKYIREYLLSTGYFSTSELENLDKVDKNFVYIKRDMTPSILAPVEAL